jgi:hypothetical protein
MLTGPGTSGYYGNDYINNGYGPLTFSNLSGSSLGSQTVGAFSVTLDPNGPSYVYSQNTHPFDVSFRITDSASGQSGVFTFQGYLQGYTSPTHMDMSYNDREAGVQGIYLNSSQPSLRLGNNVYKVSINSFGVGYWHNWGVVPSIFSSTGRPEPYDDWGKNLNASSMVSVQVTHETPEPSTLALLASGFTALGCRFWRRRRRSPKE